MNTNVDKKMKADFTEDQKTLLHGKASSIAEKYQCSKNYVNKIISGDRSIKSQLSTKIYSDLKTLVKLLTPIQ